MDCNCFLEQLFRLLFITMYIFRNAPFNAINTKVSIIFLKCTKNHFFPSFGSNFSFRIQFVSHIRYAAIAFQLTKNLFDSSTKSGRTSIDFSERDGISIAFISNDIILENFKWTFNTLLILSKQNKNYLEQHTDSKL